MAIPDVSSILFFIKKMNIAILIFIIPLFNIMPNANL